MQNASTQDAQNTNPRDIWSSPAVRVSTPFAIAVLTAVLGTAFTLTITYKPPEVLTSVASAKTAVKPPVVPLPGSAIAQDILSQVDEPIKLEVPPPLSLATSSLDYAIAPLTPKRLNSQKRQPRLNNFSWQQSELETQPNAKLKRSLQQQTSLPLSPQAAAVSLPTFSKLTKLGSEEAPRLLLRGILPQQTRQELPPPVNRYWARGRGENLTNNHTPLTTNTKSPVLQLGNELNSLVEVALKLAQGLQNHAVAEVKSSVQSPNGQAAEPALETNREQNQQQSAPEVQQLELALRDVVILAVENNRDIKNAYLERIAQRQDLAVAEDKFVPNFTPTISVSIAEFGADGITTSNSDLGAEARISVKIPTGGDLSFGWLVNNEARLDSDDSVGARDDDTFNQTLQLRFEQPILRGAGTNVNKASVDIARLTEQSNILALKSTLIDTITNAVLGYRQLLQAQERVKIEQRSLELAQQLLEVNRVLIEAGRLAPVDLVQSETAVANRQLSLLTAQSELAAAKLTLLDILDIDQDVDIVSTETLTAEPTSLDANKLRQLAFENRPDYLRTQLTRQTSELGLLLAEDNRRWDLNLTASLNNTTDSTSDVRAGLRLSHDFGDLTREQRFQRSRVDLLKAENSLENLNGSIDIEINDRIRDVNLGYTQVERARQATILSEQQLEIEREKQRLGRGSGIFELVRLQEDLARARNVELDATINYLNALTRLDKSLGTTLDTWQITIEEK